MRYPFYSPSVIRWNHDYPSHWVCEKAKRFFANPKRLNKNYEENNILSLTLGGVIRNNGPKPIGLSPSDYSKYQIFEPNELVFKLIDLENVSTSRVGFVPERGIMSSAYIRLSPRIDLNIRYFYYQYFDWYKRLIFNGLGEGVRQTLSGKDLINLEILVPPREEQNQIVSYLDWQISKTNKLISALKKQIALLKEQKRAIINKAVTKGIDPMMPMKDSGIDWIGDIPVDWNVLRLKFACRVNANTKCDLSDEDIVVFLPMENISVDGKINNEIKRKYKEVKSGFTCFRKNDVVVAKITPCFENGKGSWLSSLETDIGFGTTELIVLRSYENLLSEYLYLITQLDFFRREGAEMMTGSAGQKRIPSEFISNFRISIPQIKDQRAIIAYLDEQCSKIDSLVENVKKEIALLVEYRTRLISDVVTGQIDVRDIEVPDFEYIADEANNVSYDENPDVEEAEEE